VGSTDLRIIAADVGAAKLTKAEKLGVTVVDQSEIWQQLQAADILPR
jgi:DNA ligase (NAD+)